MAITTVHHGDVAVLALDRPEALNALGLDDMVALGDALDANAGARALVLTGTGRAFSGGAAVDWMAEAAEAGTAPERLGELVDAAHRIVRALRAGPPSVAAINGVIAGAALGFACACDVRIAVPAARFVAGFAGIGVSPDSSMTWSVPRLIGLGRATSLLMRNRPLSCDDALAWGLVTEVVAPDELLPQATAIAAGLGAGPRAALLRTRGLLESGAAAPLDAHLDAEGAAILECAHGAEFVEGVAAFVARRRPDFVAAGANGAQP